MKSGIKETKAHFGFDEPKEFNVGYIPIKSGVYRIEIDGAIESVSQFSTAIQALGMATEDDQVEIHLQCCGGNVDATGALLHAMRKCAATIHAVASGGCHSAATQILLEADSFELADNFNSLIHNGSAGSYGNLNEYHTKSDFDRKFLDKYYRSIYEGFLSEEEFDGMMRGDNIWLDAEGWCDRATKRMEYFQQKIDAFNEEQQALLEKPTKKPSTKKKPVVKEAATA